MPSTPSFYRSTSVGRCLNKQNHGTLAVILTIRDLELSVNLHELLQVNDILTPYTVTRSPHQDATGT